MQTTNRPRDRITTSARLPAKTPARREPRRRSQPRPPAATKSRAAQFEAELRKIPGVENMTPDELRAKLLAGWFRAEMGKAPNGQAILACLDGLVEIECLEAVSGIALAGAKRADEIAMQGYTAARAGAGRVDDQTAGWRWREAHARLQRAQGRHVQLQERRRLASAELQLAGQWM